MNTPPASIQLALISHTNAGKTTLARTLMGVDVGEVRDAPHVTTLSESHPLLSTPQGDHLQLWDTPGFGDSVRLFKRLAASGNPIGWFMREVVDRYADRPFWLSQQAIRTAKDSADVVLYLVNASEDPQDAGYLASEMKILQWLGKPVLVLLNQLGAPRPQADEQAEHDQWERQLAAYPVVKHVLALDAFTRCWVHERVFYDTLATLVPPDKQAAFTRLNAAWAQANDTRLNAAMALIAAQIGATAGDQERLPENDHALLGTVLSVVGLGKRREQKRQLKAMDTLMLRLNAQIALSTAQLLQLHQLDAGDAAHINERVRQAFVVREAVDTTQAGLLGGLISGAASGLSADLMSGGLSMGAGALIGGLLGALGGAGAAWAFNTSTDRQQSSVSFSSDFIRTQLVAGLLRYLAVIHHGRGRGKFNNSATPVFWQSAIEQAVSMHDEALSEALSPLQRGALSDATLAPLAQALKATTLATLAALYPPGDAPLA